MPEMLMDSFGRRIDYLRLSVMEQCNLRCFYCKPGRRQVGGGAGAYLNADQITRVVGAFAELGVSKIRVTGGEPLLRRGIATLAARINAIERVADLSLSTNGYLLGRLAAPLKSAGVNRVNISLDTLDARNYERITGGGELRRVLAGIDTAIQVGMNPVKLNMVVMKGVNDHEILDMVDFAVERGLHLRFIETMPVGSAGAAAMTHYLPCAAILRTVHEGYGEELVPVTGARGAGPARYYRIGRAGASVGVISAVSRHFCEACNRVRLNARGELWLCLGRNHRVDLAPLLRDDCSDDVLQAAICDAIARKPWSHEFSVQGVAGINQMAAIGG